MIASPAVDAVASAPSAATPIGRSHVTVPASPVARPRGSWRGLVLPAIAAAALGYAAVHVVSSSKPVVQTEPIVEPPRSPYAATVAGVGLVEPQSESISVSAVVPGAVVEVAASEGDRVAAGDLLFRLDDRQQRAELKVRQAQLAEAEAMLGRWQQMPRGEDLPPSAARVARFRAVLTMRNDQWERARRLAQQRVVTEQELVEREQAVRQAAADLAQAEAEDLRLRAGAWEADLAVARAELARAKQQVEQARVELDRLAVRAPIAGAVLKVDVRPGEFVGTPPGEPLIVLGDVDVLHVRVDVDEHDLPRFRQGMPGRGFVRGDSQAPLPLKFVRVEPLAQPKQSLTGAGDERIDTRVLQVIYEIDAPARAVYVGQQIDVFLGDDLSG